MQVCNACHVQVRAQQDYCPLCGGMLEKAECPGSLAAVNPYPDLRSRLAKFSLWRRILQAATLFCCLFSLLVNLLVTPQFWWSLFVLAGAAYCWALIPALLRRGVNLARQIVYQVLLTCLAVVLIDLIAGYRGWSVSYVIPAVLSAGILATGLMAAFRPSAWSIYVYYQVLVAAFGFAPLVLYLVGLAHSLVMVLLPAGLGMASIILTLLFADRSIKNEFVKRFHL